MTFPRSILTTIALGAFVGCATTPSIDWDARVGNYTRDQAVLDMGPPDKSAELSDGVIVAEWLTGRSPAQAVTVLRGDSYFHGPYGRSLHHVYQTAPTEWHMRLTFDPDGVLTSWKEVTR